MGSGGSRSLLPPGKQWRFRDEFSLFDAVIDRFESTLSRSLTMIARIFDLSSTNCLRLYGQASRAISTG